MICRCWKTTLSKAHDDITISGIGAPAIVCIGRVALMRQCLDWMGQMQGTPPRNLDPLDVRSESENRIMACKGFVVSGLSSGSGKNCHHPWSFKCVFAKQALLLPQQSLALII